MGTGIPYADEVVNAIVGCTHSGMPGCDNCWARELHTMRHMAYLAGKDMPQQYAKPFEEIQLFPERLERVLHWRKPRRIFWCSMSDMFHKDVPDEYLCQILRTIALSPQHTHLILTKRVKRMADVFSKLAYTWWWVGAYGEVEHPNVWTGISCSTQEDLDRMAPVLLQIPAAHYWLSLEPLVEDVDVYDTLIPVHQVISWVVVGCESLRGRVGRLQTPELINNPLSGVKYSAEELWWQAARNIKDQCLAAGAAFYMKQGPPNGKIVTDPAKFPEDLRIRELPIPQGK